jgi:hypothetical protein
LTPTECVDIPDVDVFVDRQAVLVVRDDLHVDREARPVGIAVSDGPIAGGDEISIERRGDPHLRRKAPEVDGGHGAADPRAVGCGGRHRRGGQTDDPEPREQAEQRQSSRALKTWSFRI